MPVADPTTTTVSSKGQVVLPKAVRERRNWPEGTRLVVEETPDGVLLRAAGELPRTRIEDVFGVLKRPGPARSIEEMDAALLEDVAREHGRD